MDTAEWRKSIEEKKEIPSAVLALVKDAWYSECWIQDNQTFEWYTPEEFKAVWERFYLNDKRKGDNIKRFSIRDPYLGELAKKKAMRDAMADYLKFRTKIDDYYKTELKRKS